MPISHIHPPSRSLRLLLIVWSVSALLTGHLVAAEPQEVFEVREFKDKDEVLLYRLMKPANYDPAKKYPLVLFLHGSGERGDDNKAQLIHGMKDFAQDENRQKYPCFVMAPQCPKEHKWVEIDWSVPFHDMPEEPAAASRLTLATIDALAKEFSLDADRLYITGLSMGGYGTWDLIQRYPEKFAAAVPVCGGGDEVYASRLTKLPLWAFHGALDKAVHPGRSRRMIKAITIAGGQPKYTEYPDVGHDSWVKAYSDPEMMAWLFAQKRSPAKDVPAAK